MLKRSMCSCTDYEAMKNAPSPSAFHYFQISPMRNWYVLLSGLVRISGRFPLAPTSSSLAEASLLPSTSIRLLRSWDRHDQHPLAHLGTSRSRRMHAQQF